MKARKQNWKPEAGVYRELPLELIDEPEMPIRESFDEQKLQELADSIQAVGVVEPILVEEKPGGRFEVLAGHRRLLATRRTTRRTIPAIVFQRGNVSAAAIRLHENTYREDLNPAQEARYFEHLLQEYCGGDVDKLCEMLRQKRPYVEERLLLVRGDAAVFRAVAEGQIGLMVARELNRVKDRGYRHVYLDAARKGGATARLVQQWRIDNERYLQAVDDIATTGQAGEYVPPPPPITTLVCCLCEGSDDPHELELLYMHRYCRKTVFERFLDRLRAPAGKPE